MFWEVAGMNMDVYDEHMDHCRRGIVEYILDRITLYLVVMRRNMPAHLWEYLFHGEEELVVLVLPNW